MNNILVAFSFVWKTMILLDMEGKNVFLLKKELGIPY